MDIEAEQFISRHLTQGEQLLWTGRPRRRFTLGLHEIFLIPFGTFFFGFSVFWVLTAIDSGAPLPFAAFGSPFILVGLYLMFGRFFVQSRKRGRTYYGITDRRIIIVSGLFRESVKSLNLRTLSDLSLRERRDGSGTITFGPANPMYSWFAGSGWPGMGQFEAPCFELIPNVKQVYEQIVSVQHSTG